MSHDIQTFKGLDNIKQITKIENNSDEIITRARIFFKNGHQLSVIRGCGTYGAEEGLFEIMPSEPRVLLHYKNECSDTVLGHLTESDVVEYAEKLAALPDIT